MTTTVNDELRLALGLLAGAETDEDIVAAYGLVTGAKYNAEDRARMAKNGQAMPDGGYPIADEEDLVAAISAVGRGSGSHDAIRAHIIRRAKALGKQSMIPDNWNSDGSMKAQMDHAYTDSTGTGTCDVCGMPMAAHEAMSSLEIIMDTTSTSAGSNAASGTITFTVGAADAPPDGIPFTVTWMAATNHPTGDGRTFEHFDLAPLPWPWSTQFSLDDGHDGAVVTGRVVSAELSEDGVVRGKGVYMLTDDGIRAARLAAEKAMPGCSINADEAYEMSVGEDGGRIYHSARIRGATQCQIPAFVETNIDVDLADVAAAEAAIAAGSAQVVEAAEALVAAAPRWAPPAGFFDDPEFGDPETDDRLCPYLGRDGRIAGYKSPLRLLADGRIVTHIAGWNECHISFEQACVKPPPSATGYAYFHRGSVLCADGQEIPVGVLAMATGHAAPDLNGIGAAAHYDNTGTIAAFGRVGEDRHGIWFSGVVNPDLTDGQLATLRATGPSGDWRREGGSLELVSSLQVPTQGFPSLRTRVLVADGRCMTLIAAGAEPVVERSVDAGLARRVAAIESILAPSLEAAADAALAAMED